MRWPKYWSFSFNIIPSKEIPGLISFRMDWLDLLAVQGTLKGLHQHHNSKASILWQSSLSLWKVKSLSHVRLFATSWTVAHQAPPSMGFSRQEYWSGLPFPSPGESSRPRDGTQVSRMQADALTSELPGKPLFFHFHFLYSTTLTSIYDYWKNHSLN